MQCRALVAVAPASALYWCSSCPCTTGDLSSEQLTQRGDFCVTEHVHTAGALALLYFFVAPQPQIIVDCQAK